MKQILKILCLILIGLNTEVVAAFELGDEWERIDIHGFISQGFMKSDQNNVYAHTEDGTFQFNEFGINFSAELTDHLRAGLQLFSRDLGDVGNNEIILDWAVADYRWKDWLGLRAGKIKIPYGFYNYTRDIDIARTNIFLPQSVYNDYLRDSANALQGIGVYGYLFLNALGSVTYQTQYGEIHINPDQGLAKLLADWFGRPINQADLNIANFDLKNISTGSLEWNTPLDGLRLGASIMRGNGAADLQTLSGESLPLNLKPIEIATLSVEYTYKNLVLAAEYFAVEMDTEISTVILTDGMPIPMTISDTRNIEGYYGSIAYRFTDWFELGAYYSEFYPNKDDKDGKEFEAQGIPKYNAWKKQIVLTTRFDINKYWALKLEGHFIDGAAVMLSQDNPDGVEEDTFLFAIKTTYNF